MKFFRIIFLGFVTLLTASGCDSETVEPVGVDTTEVITDVVEINTTDIDGLKFMREEEKLARDVYISLFAMYDNQVFNNISNSEQRHMDEVLKLLNTYNIEDPSLDETGKFSNQILQQLYDDLMAQGSISEVEALIVGATIEDVDIRDLELFITETTNEDIIKVYEFLNCGSRNHMRAFISKLNDLGVTYTPQFITQEQFDSIINGDKEKCGQNYNR